mmetsp:Transcript_4146/g.15163  ORF Transcript_4146/g.15163 Transcript_4146/m.15163 type:complete len:270 (+) Transcript_4146:3122-3931(+)
MTVWVIWHLFNVLHEFHLAHFTHERVKYQRLPSPVEMHAVTKNILAATLCFLRSFVHVCQNQPFPNLTRQFSVIIVLFRELVHDITRCLRILTDSQPFILPNAPEPRVVVSLLLRHRALLVIHQRRCHDNHVHRSIQRQSYNLPQIRAILLYGHVHSIPRLRVGVPHRRRVIRPEHNRHQKRLLVRITERRKHMWGDAQAPARVIPAVAAVKRIRSAREFIRKRCAPAIRRFKRALRERIPEEHDAPALSGATRGVSPVVLARRRHRRR